MTSNRTRHLPLALLGVALALLVLATTFYPGGTADDPATIGFDWSRNYISALFQPEALNGAPNPSRPLAVISMLVLCVCLALAFRSIARSAAHPRQRKVIEIAGLNTTVYAFLAVTPMHDLMITIALPFTAVTLIAILHLLFAERNFGLFAFGLACFTLKAFTAFVYYVEWSLPLLAVLQKLNLVATAAWLLAVHYTRSVTTQAAPPA